MAGAVNLTSQAFTAEEVRADLEATSARIRKVAPAARLPYFRALRRLGQYNA